MTQNADYVPVLPCPGSGEGSDESSKQCAYCGDEYVITPTGKMPNHPAKDDRR